MTTVESFLKNLGLTKKETETFLKLLELGAQPASVIARHVGIPRSSMYLVLENLKSLALVEEFDRAQVKYFKCIPAEQLANVIKMRERKLQVTSDLLVQALPELQRLENKMSITPKIKFFEGSEEIMKMYEEVLAEEDFCAMFSPELAKDIVPEPYLAVPKILRERGGKVRELVTASPEGRKYRKENNAAIHRIRILPDAVKLETDLIICSDRVYFVAYGDAQISATEIYSASLVASQKSVFEYLWSVSA